MASAELHELPRDLDGDRVDAALVIEPLASIIANQFGESAGIQRSALIGFGLVLWMRSLFTVQADFATIMVPTILQGAAIAFFFIPLSAITRAPCISACASLPSAILPSGTSTTDWMPAAAA